MAQRILRVLLAQNNRDPCIARNCRERSLRLGRAAAVQRCNGCCAWHSWPQGDSTRGVTAQGQAPRPPMLRSSTRSEPTLARPMPPIPPVLLKPGLVSLFVHLLSSPPSFPFPFPASQEFAVSVWHEKATRSRLFSWLGLLIFAYDTPHSVSSTCFAARGTTTTSSPTDISPGCTILRRLASRTCDANSVRLLKANRTFAVLDPSLGLLRETPTTAPRPTTEFSPSSSLHRSRRARVSHCRQRYSF